MPAVVYAQEFQITGTVTDASDGSPLMGVIIKSQDQSATAITDLDGGYSVKVKKGDVLTFSYLGMKSQNVTVESNKTINVAMSEDNVALGEVVVVGYGTMKKRDLTGSVSSLNGDKLKEAPVVNFDQAMQGKLAGVQVTSNSGTPGAATTIRVRGTTSITSGNEPLYIIDGVPVSGKSEIAGFDWAGGGNGQNKVNPLAAISPSDIVSIDVLKDASASAIYGSAGANGVVLVTTRRGKAGETKVTYDGYTAVSSIPKKLDMMDLRQYAVYQQELSADLGNPLSDYFKDPSLLGKGEDWQDAVFRTAWLQSHSVSLTGGTDKLQFSASAGWFDQDGVVIGSGFNRFNTRLNFDGQAKKWLKVGGSLAFARTNETITLNDGQDGVITTALLMGPNVPVRDMNGEYAGPESVEGVSWNPVAIAMQRSNKLLRNKTMGSFYASADIMKGLVLRSEYAFDAGNNTNKAFHPSYHWGALKNDIIRIMQRDDQSYFWIQTNTLNWDKKINDKNNLSVMLGFETQASTWEGTQLVKKNLSNDDIKVIGVDGLFDSNSGWKDKATQASYFGRANYNYADKYYLTATLRRDGSSKFGSNNVWGTFPSLSLAWRASEESFLQNNAVISNLKLRAGYGEVGNSNISTYMYGSSMMPVSTPLGTAYRVKNISNPNLKWETSVQYNVGIDVALFGGRIDLIFDAYYKTTRDLLLQISIPSYLGGPDYEDIQSPFANIGKVDNKGFDFTLSTHNIKSKDFNWTSSTVFSLNRGEVKELNDNSQAYYGKLNWYSEFQTATITKVGKPLGVFYGYKTAGLFKDKEDILNHSVQKADPENPNINYVNKTAGVWVGDIKFVDLNDDGFIDTDDQTIIGDPNPDFTFGFNNNFTYKDFDLALSITGSVGGDILNYSKVLTEGQTSIWNNQSVDVVNRAKIGLKNPNGSATDPNNVYLIETGATIPRAATNDVNRNNRMSDRFIEDGSYVRLSNISLGYTIPRLLTSKYGIERLRVYASAQNLFTITGYSGYDPEVGAYNQNALLQNVDMGRYPTPRMFTFGVNLSF